MKIFVSFALMFLFAVVSFADNLPDAPAPKVVGAYYTSQPHSVVRPGSSKVWSLEAIIIGGLYATDGVITQEGIHREHCYPSGNAIVCLWPSPEKHSWLYGKYPSAKREALTMAAIYVGTVTALHFTENSKHRWVRWAGRAFAVETIEQEAVSIHSWH